MTMENEEYDLCNKKCKSFLKKDRYGKMYLKEQMNIFESIFREGYSLGKKEQEKFANAKDKVPTHKEFQKEVDKSGLRGFKFSNSKKNESPQDMCECGHERQWHDFGNLEECRVDIAEDPEIDCYCLKFRNAKVHAEEKKG